MKCFKKQNFFQKNQKKVLKLLEPDAPAPARHLPRIERHMAATISELSISQRSLMKTPEELKTYNRMMKKKSRLQLERKAEADRLAKIIPKCRQYVMPDSQRKKIDTNLAATTAAIKTELPQLSEQDSEILDGMSAVITGFENNYFQNIHEPEGVLIGGHFCDAMASICIEYVHRHPQIMESKTFSDLYRKFVSAVSKWCRKNIRSVTPEFMRDVERETDGSYELPPERIIEPLPEQVEPQPPPLTLESMRSKLSEQLLNDYSQFENSRPEMAREAQSYLDGEKIRRKR
jgi:hypothetical protein